MKATATARLFPVVPVTTVKGVGTEELLSLIAQGFPTPSLHPNPGDPPQRRRRGVRLDPAAPLVAQVIRTTTDPFAGRLSMVRIFSGTLHADSRCTSRGTAATSSARRTGRTPTTTTRSISQVQQAVGTELKPKASAIAGEIVMLPKLTTAETGDTISAKDSPGVVPNWKMPEPLLPLAIRAASRNDEDKLSGALQRLAVEDTTVRLARGASDQLVLWTTGQAHADLLLNRLRDRYGVNVVAEDVKIPLRETFVAKADALGRH